jgi:hypothetical protein
MAGRLLIGTSSWADPGFVEEWYPPGLPARDRLAWYAERFAAVEVNSTFYAVPDQGTVARWAQVTPDGFTFDVKLHRLLSRHSADLKSLPPALREGAQTSGRGRVGGGEAGADPRGHALSVAPCPRRRTRRACGTSRRRLSTEPAAWPVRVRGRPGQWRPDTPHMRGRASRSQG